MIVNINNNPSVGVNHISGRTQSDVRLPDSMLSRSEPAMSEEAFRERIEEMARRDAAAGRFQSHDVNSEYHQLLRKFMSTASPDRQGMINAAFPSMIGKIRMLAQSNPPVRTLLELLLLGEEIPQSFNPGQELVLFQLKDENGNLLAELTTGGWTMFSTDAENARASEFMSIYNNAWRAARAEMGTQNNTTQNVSTHEIAAQNTRVQWGNRIQNHTPALQQVTNKYEEMASLGQ